MAVLLTNGSESSMGRAHSDNAHTLSSDYLENSGGGEKPLKQIAILGKN